MPVPPSDPKGKGKLPLTISDSKGKGKLPLTISDSKGKGKGKRLLKVSEDSHQLRKNPVAIPHPIIRDENVPSKEKQPLEVSKDSHQLGKSLVAIPHPIIRDDNVHSKGKQLLKVGKDSHQIGKSPRGGLVYTRCEEELTINTTSKDFRSLVQFLTGLPKSESRNVTIPPAQSPALSCQGYPTTSSDLNNCRTGCRISSIPSFSPAILSSKDQASGSTPFSSFPHSPLEQSPYPSPNSVLLSSYAPEILSSKDQASSSTLFSSFPHPPLEQYVSTNQALFSSYIPAPETVNQASSSIQPGFKLAPYDTFSSTAATSDQASFPNPNFIDNQEPKFMTLQPVLGTVNQASSSIPIGFNLAPYDTFSLEAGASDQAFFPDQNFIDLEAQKFTNLQPAQTSSSIAPGFNLALYDTYSPAAGTLDHTLFPNPNFIDLEARKLTNLQPPPGTVNQALYSIPPGFNSALYDTYFPATGTSEQASFPNPNFIDLEAQKFTNLQPQNTNSVNRNLFDLHDQASFPDPNYDPFSGQCHPISPGNLDERQNFPYMRSASSEHENPSEPRSDV